MAFCSCCGKELSNGARFCASCGASVVIEKPVQDGVNSRQKMVYDGKVYKCPNCGEQMDAFVATCPACGYELRGTQITSRVHELSQKLEHTDSAEKKIELIHNFYIPNTKEDIYEFCILAYSNISVSAYGADVWKVKLEQAYLKARLVFDNGGEFKYIDELYRRIKRTSIRNKILKSKWVRATFVFSFGLMLMLGGFLIPPIFSIEDINISVPLFLTGFAGMLPLLVGTVMYIIPERKANHKK